jgi:hypothetical protein
MQRAVHYLSAQESRSWVLEGAALREAEPGDGAQLVAVVDFAEESYVPAKLPAMRGGDGALLRRRRLEREFPGAQLAAVQRLRRRRGADNEDAVMVAVPAGAPLQESLAALASRHALRAVTTPALLAGEWLRRARFAQPRVLIVLPTPAGVRLVFLADGRPTLSRLTGALAPQQTAAEIARTVQYLQNTQRVERGEAVPLWFWGVDDATAVACIPAGAAVAPSASPRVAALPDPERDGLTALLALAAERPGQPQLAPDELRLGWLTQEFARGCRLAAAAAAVLLVVAAGVLEWRVESASRAIDAQVAARDAIEAGAAQLDADLERRGLTLAEVATFPETEQVLLRNAVDLATDLAIVGVGFAAQRDVEVQALDLRAAPLEGSAESLAGPMQVVNTPAEGAEPEVDTCDAGVERSMRVEFGLATGLDVRRRDAALGWVREASGALAPWRAGAAAGTLGRHDPLVVSAGREEARAETRWSVCLRREMAP